MNLDDALKNRRSVREFQDESISRKEIEAIVQAGLLAPTASNRQHWRIVAITDPSIIRDLYEKVGAQDIVFNPPVVLTVVYNPLFNARRSAHVQSTAAAVQNMLLKATEMGYGTTWVAGMGDDRELRKLLEIPDTWEPLCYVLLGRIVRTFPPPPPKYELDEVLFFNKFVEDEVDLPNSIKPRKCTLDQIANHQRYLSRASYLGKDYDYQHSLEIEAIIEKIGGVLGGDQKHVVTFFSYDGTVFRHLNPLMKQHKFTDVELSDAACDFVKFKSPDATYVLARENTSLPSSCADHCICLFSLEKMPDYKTILQEVERLLVPEGELLLFFKNKHSAYGLLYVLVEKILGVRSLSAVFPLSPGPYEPISATKLIRDVNNAGFSVARSDGMFFIPAELLIFSDKVDGYLKRHGKYMNVFRIFVKPAIKFGVLMLKATRWATPFRFSSSCFLLAVKGAEKD